MFKKPFRLVSPLTREECAARLRAAAQLEDPVHFTYQPVPDRFAIGTVREAEYQIRRRRMFGGKYGLLLQMRLTDEEVGSCLEGQTELPAWEVVSYFGMLALMSFLWLPTRHYFLPAVMAGYFPVMLYVSRRDGQALVDFVKRTVDG
ncbi:MAG: hypothetical protein JWO82_488 [Akkermansiaceae bacterium]|nr:hypothetical protein [Akkermansiaceae bacterium]